MLIIWLFLRVSLSQSSLISGAQNHINRSAYPTSREQEIGHESDNKFEKKLSQSDDNLIFLWHTFYDLVQLV